MSDKIYPKGIRVFPKHAKAPEFVLGTVIVSVDEFVAWVNDNHQLLTEYNGEQQLKLQLLTGNKGIYMQVDTYKKEESF